MLGNVCIYALKLHPDNITSDEQQWKRLLVGCGDSVEVYLDYRRPLGKFMEYYVQLAYNHTTTLSHVYSPGYISAIFTQGI